MPQPLTQAELDALAARGFRWAELAAALRNPGTEVNSPSVIFDQYSEPYRVAWSGHEQRWECNAAHVDAVLREVQSGTR